MKITVIGGTGHIGTYLCPMLVREGHGVACVTRGASSPYRSAEEWADVRMLRLDRSRMAADEFASAIARERADVVIDLINFSLGDVKAMRRALGGGVGQYVYCSSCWAEGAGGDASFQSRQHGERAAVRVRAAEIRLGAIPAGGARLPLDHRHAGQISGAGWAIINPWATA